MVEPEVTAGLSAGQLVVSIEVEQAIVISDYGGDLASLLGGASELRTTSSVVCDETTQDFVIGDLRIRTRTVTTNSVRWQASDDQFDILASRITGSELLIEAVRINGVAPLGNDFDSREIRILVGPQASGAFELMGYIDVVDVDTDGIPVIAPKLSWSGRFSVRDFVGDGWVVLLGSAEIELRTPQPDATECESD